MLSFGRNFGFSNAVSEDEMNEAFQMLVDRKVIIACPSRGPAIYQLTGLGRSVSVEDVFEKTIDVTLVSRLSELLDTDLARECLGKSKEDAITNAFRILETRIRNRVGADASLVGVDLADAAFHPSKGKLIVGQADSEKQAVHLLFRSAFGAFRNPASHRYVQDLGEADVLEVVVLVDLLLRLLNRASSRT